jgi:hypothetical protein
LNYTIKIEKQLELIIIHSMPVNQQQNRRRHVLSGIVKRTVLNKPSDYTSIENAGANPWIYYTSSNYKMVAEMICESIISAKDISENAEANKTKSNELWEQTYIYTELKEYCNKHHLGIRKTIDKWLDDPEVMKKFRKAYRDSNGNISELNHNTNGLWDMVYWNKTAFHWLWALYTDYIEEHIPLPSTSCDCPMCGGSNEEYQIPRFVDIAKNSAFKFYGECSEKPSPKYVNVCELLRSVHNAISIEYAEPQ